jgi:sulfhydrogenase subunit beta (sulfur reductase)
MPHWLERQAFGALLGALRSRGYRVLGPVVRDGVLAWGDVRDPCDLAAGWRDRQEPGSYRLEPAPGPRWFTAVNGPGSLKPLLFAPREPLLQITWGDPDGALQVTPQLPASERIAVLGARACDLAAVAVQDRVFLGDRVVDPQYAARRRGLLLIGMSCTRSAPTCFCASLGTGPAVASGHDLALTELDDGFLVRAGSAAGEEILSDLPLAPTDGAALEGERSELQACAAGMQRALQPADPRDLLYANLEHPRWDEVGARCLSCGNCTQVCPTCFCHDEHDEPALDGPRSLRVREWDSCFNRDHGQIHGHCFRPSIRDRYRQWLVHKLASWIDQFGTSGCVGCGRCISWCPVGIDLTEEVAAIRGTPGAPSPAPTAGLGAGPS